MLNDIKLYIDNKHVPFYKNETINYIVKLKDLTDFGKVFVPYSKEFVIAASPIANQIFKYFGSDFLERNTNPNVAKEAKLYINNSLFKVGYIKLINASYKFNKLSSYKIIFYDKTIEVKQILKDKLLKDLDLSRFNHVYNYYNVRQGLVNSDITDNGLNTGTVINPNREVVYPYIDYKRRLIASEFLDDKIEYHEFVGNALYASDNKNMPTYDEFKPAIKIVEVIKAINTTFEDLEIKSDFFDNDTNFNKIYMYLNGVDNNPLINGKENIINRGTIQFTHIAYPHSNIKGYNNTVLELLSQNGCNCNGQCNHPTVKFRLKAIVTVVTNDIPFSVTFNERLQNVYNETLTNTQSFDYVLPNDFYGNDCSVYYELVTVVESAEQIEIKVAFEVTEIYDDVDQTPYTHDYPDYTTLMPTITIDNNLPNIKIIDFLTGVMKHFNLIVYSSLEFDYTGTIPVINPIIRIETLDDYLTNLKTVDVTKYINIEKLDKTVPTIYNNVEFNMTESTYNLNEAYKNINGIEFGNLIFNFSKYYSVGHPDNKANQNDNMTIQSIFQAMVYERLLKINSTGTVTNINTDIGYGMATNKDIEMISGNGVIMYLELQSAATGLSPSISDNQSQVMPDSELTSYLRPRNGYDDSGYFHVLTFSKILDYYTLTNTNVLTIIDDYYDKLLKNIYNNHQNIINVNGILPIKVTNNTLNLSVIYILNGVEYIFNSIDLDLRTGKLKLELMKNFNF